MIFILEWEILYIQNRKATNCIHFQFFSLIKTRIDARREEKKVLITKIEIVSNWSCVYSAHFKESLLFLYDFLQHVFLIFLRLQLCSKNDKRILFLLLYFFFWISDIKIYRFLFKTILCLIQNSIYHFRKVY